MNNIITAAVHWQLRTGINSDKMPTDIVQRMGIMKNYLKKLLLFAVALIVVFAYTKITGSDAGDSVQQVSDVVQAVLPEAPVAEKDASASASQEDSSSIVEETDEQTDTIAAGTQVSEEPDSFEAETAPQIEEDGVYTTKEDVALYIHTYGKLPANFITKKEAEAAGWPGGNLEPYCPGKCIGGSHFGNYEGLLPDKKGRSWTECDIDTLGAKSRGAKRIIFSNDGLIYYTDDHYESFELLYGEP